MIKILPYYERGDIEGGKLLALYLNIVADVVPFPAEDVIDGVSPAKSIKCGMPRKRTPHYNELLKTYLDSGEYEGILLGRISG